MHRADSQRSMIYKSNFSIVPMNSTITDSIIIKHKKDCFYTNKFLKKTREICSKIVHSQHYQVIMNAFIICNCVCLTFNDYPVVERQVKLQIYANYIFYVIYLVELIIKLLGLGFKKYKSDTYNIYDAFIVVIGSADFIISIIPSDHLSIVKLYFSASRIFRLLKLVKSYFKLKILLSTIGNTIHDLRHFMILIFLFNSSSTLFGIEYFAQKIKFNSYNNADLVHGTSPRLNFDKFLNGFLTVFALLQGDSWNSIMYDADRSVGQASKSFFVVIVVCGNIILLKLFLAVLLENFEDKRKEIEEEHKRDEINQQNLIKAIKEKTKAFLNKFSCFHRLIKLKIFSKMHSNQDSLLIFSKDNKFRKLCLKLQHSRLFGIVVLFLILVSCVQLALESPLEDPKSTKIVVMYYVDMVITVLFQFEVIIKVVGSGLVFCGDASYMRSKWNLLDFAIVLISTAALSSSIHALKFLAIMRMGRILRPLRVIGKNQGMKLALQTLIHAIPAIINVGLVTLIFYLIFGIFCVTFVKGQYFSCYTKHLSQLNGINLNDIITKLDCINQGGEWMNQVRNFDGTLHAVELLFSVSLVNWQDSMFRVVDKVGVDMQPQTNTNGYWIFFFVTFMIVFCFFLLNLFVGVVVMTFHEQKEKLGKNFLLTDTQKEWLGIKMRLLRTKPMLTKTTLSSNIIRKVCYKIVRNKAFKIFILVCIILNSVVLTLNWYLMPESIININSYLSYGFTVVFFIEAALKIIGLGKTYFKSNKNILDFFILLAQIIGILLDIFLKQKNIARTTVIKAFRIVMMVRIVQRTRILKLVLKTFVAALPSLANVGGLLILIIYMYAVLGVKLFGLVKLQQNLNQQANFQSFGVAFLTLIRIMTGEGWDQILSDLTTPYSIINQCTNDFSVDDYLATGKINGCGKRTAEVYIFSFTLLVSLVFLNLFVAIVLDNFDDMNKKDNELLNDKNMKWLKRCWSEFDRDGTCFIKIKDFDSFLVKLGEPLGFSLEEQNSERLQFDFLKKLELPTYNAYQDYYYYDVTLSLTQVAYLKMESRRKLQEQLTSSKISYEELSKEVLDSIKKELGFESEIFKVHNIEALTEASQKEKSIYSKILQKKDSLDSQHLWAQHRIIKLYKKTTLHFRQNTLKNTMRIPQQDNLKFLPKLVNDLEEQKQDNLFVIQEVHSNQSSYTQFRDGKPSTQNIQSHPSFINKEIQGDQSINNAPNTGDAIMLFRKRSSSANLKVDSENALDLYVKEKTASAVGPNEYSLIHELSMPQENNAYPPPSPIVIPGEITEEAQKDSQANLQNHKTIKEQPKQKNMQQKSTKRLRTIAPVTRTSNMVLDIVEENKQVETIQVLNLEDPLPSINQHIINIVAAWYEEPPQNNNATGNQMPDRKIIKRRKKKKIQLSMNNQQELKQDQQEDNQKQSIPQCISYRQEEVKAPCDENGQEIVFTINEIYNEDS